jgi:hypothetical protein
MTALRTAPLTTVPQVDCQAKPSSERCQCGVCGKVFAGGSVVTGDPVWSEDHESHVVVRSLYCDHCNHVMHWLEASTEAGRPLGVLLSGPGFVRQARAVERFLQRHPEAAGVAQA